MLEVHGARIRFGGLVAVDGVDLSVATGEVHCIIGPNGAGKSTLLNALSCEQRLHGGEMWLDGHRIDRLQPHQAARVGIARKFQVPAVFYDLTVVENLSIAAAGTASLRALLGVAAARVQLVATVMERIRLAEKARVLAGELSHGEVQWLEIGMVLINRPRVLLLDEPTAGMTPAETLDTAALLSEIAAETSATMIIVEHDLEFVRTVGHQITVMHKGAVLAQGDIGTVENDPRVRAVYLGHGSEAGDAP